MTAPTRSPAASAETGPLDDDSLGLQGIQSVIHEALGRLEMQIAFDRKPETSTDTPQIIESNVTHLRIAETQVTKTEGNLVLWVQLGQEPRASTVRRENLNDRPVIDLGAAILLALAVCDEVLNQLLSDLVGNNSHISIENYHTRSDSRSVTE